MSASEVLPDAAQTPPDKATTRFGSDHSHRQIYRAYWALRRFLAGSKGGLTHNPVLIFLTEYLHFLFDILIMWEYPHGIHKTRWTAMV